MKFIVPILIFVFSCAASGQSRPIRQTRHAPAQTTADYTLQQAESAQIAHVSKTTDNDRQSVEVTIYNNNLGLVKERRRVNIIAGTGELQFMDVPSQINPVTVHVRPLANAADFAILEQNYEFDLISHEKLMDKYIGKNIRIMQWNRHRDRKEIVEAKLLSTTNGEVYRINGEIYLGHLGIRILPELPGNLVHRPTLSWIYNNKTTRDYVLEVSYLTGGMNWNADYILSIGSGNASAGLSGWVTVNNTSGASFEHANLNLVAGTVNRILPRPQLRKRGSDGIGYGSGFGAATSAFQQTELFEYYMYDFQRPATIKNNQTKQINLMESHGITVVQEYTTIADRNRISHFRQSNIGESIKQPVVTFLTAKNSKDNNLGDPLPAGIVRIYTADAQGRKQFIGEDRIQHTPRDEEIRMRVGEAFDIVAERTQANFRQVTTRQFEAEWTITIRNRKQNENIMIRVIESAHGTWKITESTHKHTQMDINTFRFDVSVKSGEEIAIKYKIRMEI